MSFQYYAFCVRFQILINRNFVNILLSIYLLDYSSLKYIWSIKNQFPRLKYNQIVF